jgi:ribonuclease HI
MPVSKHRKKQYYIVVKGHQPGIYSCWNGPGGAAEQVQNVPHALYKGFYTRDEAIAWMKQVEASELLDELGLDQDSPIPIPSLDHQPMLDEGKVVIYTDGAAIGNPGPGGYGVVLLYKEHRREISGGFHLTTNNRMELKACIEALKALKFPCSVIIYSDSRYVVDGINKGWAERWSKQGWYRNSNDKAKNADLWEDLLEQLSRHEVEFHWVKGHAGHDENERCDHLAMAAARGSDLSPDEGFHGSQAV